MADESKTNDLTVRIAEKREAAKTELAKRRLHLPRRPNYDLPRLPSNLTDLNGDDVMALFVQLVRYQDHIAGLHVICEIDESSAETVLKVAEARHIAGEWSGSSTDRVAISKAKAVLDPDVRRYDDALLAIKAKRKLYGVLVESLARDAAVVSREITRRTGSAPHAGRADRFTP